MFSDATNEKRHPIQIVARRTGLTPDVLRAWEKRYAAIEPDRTPGSRRLYSDEDVRRLLLLKRATLLGRSIGRVANLPTPELNALVESDEEGARAARAAVDSIRSVARGRGARADDEPGPGAAARARAAGSSGDAATATRHLEACLAAAQDLDPSGLEAALGNASLDLSRIALIEKVLIPLMREVGDRWHDGTMRVAHEHAASAVVRSFLGRLAENPMLPDSAPSIVVATPAGQAHELGAMVVAAVAGTDGWRVTYLGPNLPAEDIAMAARHRRARALALSLIYPTDDAHVIEELRVLGRLLPGDVVVLVGGIAAPAYQETIDAVGAVRVADLTGLRAELQRIRSAPFGR